MNCAICEKAIYGHVSPGPETSVVCGSCTLKKTASSKAGKSFAEARLDLAKVLNKEVQKRDTTMSDYVVTSNYARNRTILLDGRYPLTFDGEGCARLPAHLLGAFSREMFARPGRYSFATIGMPKEEPIVEEITHPEPVVTEPVVEKINPIVEKVSPSKKEDFEELFEEEPKKLAPAKGKKK